MSIERVKTKKFKSGYGYRIDFHRRGHKRVRKTFATRPLAQAVLDKLTGDAVKRGHGLPVNSGVTIEILIEHHLAKMCERGRDKKNTKRAETVLNRFAGIAGKDTLVEKIKRSDLRRYAEARLSKPKPPKKAPSPQSINREMNEIKGCLTKATTYYPALEDWQPPKGTWFPAPQDGRRQTWDEGDAARVIAELFAPKGSREQEWQVEGRRDVGELFIIVRRTGMRPGEVRQLRKSQIDLKAGVILVSSKKGSSPRAREVPIPDELLEILKRRTERAKGQYLFPGFDPDKPRSDYLQVFKRACERAGVTPGYKGVTMYDARRTAENEMLEAGHSPRAVGDIFGHSAETMVKHYARSTREQRRLAVESTKQSVHKLSTSAPEMPDLPDLPTDKEKTETASSK
jgi:integrase